MTKALMIQGTSSNAGKSLLVAGLCRVLHNRGYSVKPFKPQNMSNNAAVTRSGGEVGRAQALQAMAARCELVNDMNPVLLKPQSELGSQLIVNGKIRGNYNAREYQEIKPNLLAEVMSSYHRLSRGSDFVIIEGAGSASEVNLRDGDIANMGFAVTAKVPVILTSDISRGGIIASLVGTHKLLSGDEKALLKGYIVNRFLGDISLFTPALDIITKHTKLNSLGILPELQEASLLPSEDIVTLEDTSNLHDKRNSISDARVKISILKIKGISNFDDFDPLIQEENVDVAWIHAGEVIPTNSDLIIIPGTKTTILALQNLKKEGWDIDIKYHLRRGGKVLGICGGYQLLGDEIIDKYQLEGNAQREKGLGFFNMTTKLSKHKTLQEVEGKSFEGDIPFSGYKMHIGKTLIKDDNSTPFLRIGDDFDGLISNDTHIMGCYIHGLFQSDNFRRKFLENISNQPLKPDSYHFNYTQQVEGALDKIAQQMEQHLKIADIIKLCSE